MCAIMVFEVKPLNVTWTLSVLAAGSSVIVADPVAGELLDGISFAPKRLVTKVVGFAWAPATGRIRAANSINILYRRMKSSPIPFHRSNACRRRHRGNESCRQI